MKIILITNYWINSDGGGVKEYSKNLVSYLKKKIEVKVIFRKGIDKSNYHLSTNKVLFLFQAINILKFEKPDVILCQGGWFTDLAALIYKFKNSKSIIKLFHTHFDSKMSFLKKKFYDFIYSKFDRIGFVSKGLKKNINTVANLKLDEKKIFILYAGVKCDFPSKEEIEIFRKKFGIKKDNIYLLGLGLTALSAKKEGAKMLIKILYEVSKKYKNVNLILTRKGNYLNELKHYSYILGINDRIIFTGDLESPYPAIACSDIYTHITYGDGLPLSLLEAMYFEKPIVASNLAGIPEAIEDGYSGILIENNVKLIKKAIIRLIEDKSLRKKLSKNAKKVAIKNFSWKKTANDLINEIDRL